MQSARSLYNSPESHILQMVLQLFLICKLILLAWRGENLAGFPDITKATFVRQ